MHEPEPEQGQSHQAPASKPAFPKQYLCKLKANVRPSPDLNGPKLREIQPGARVMILEIATREGHLRGRIESESVGHESEWLSIRTKLGNQLLVPVDGGPSRADQAAEPGFPPDQTVERVKFLAPKTRQDGEGRSYTVYCVRCFPQEGAPWEVERRFSDFYSLWYELEAAGATAVNRLDFPSKTSSLFVSKEALEQERRTTLEQFLNFLIYLGGTESKDKKVSNCWPGEKATMLFLAPWPDEDCV